MRFIDEKHIELGHIMSYWSWEYDSIAVKASLLMDITNLKLLLDITKKHIKTGIGAGETNVRIATYDVGTLTKPYKGMISQLLAKHKQTDRPFKRDGWITEYSNRLKLHEVFDEILNKELGITRAIKLNKIKKVLTKQK